MIRLVATFIFALFYASPGYGQRYAVNPDYAWAPFVEFDALGSKFCLWYNRSKGNHLSLIYRQAVNPSNSQAWSRQEVLMVRPGYGTNIVDEGVPGPQRFKRALYWDGVGRIKGLYLQTSSDGKVWNYTTSDPIFARSEDIVNLWKDPRTGTYGMFIKNTVNGMRETVLSRSSDFG